MSTKKTIQINPELFKLTGNNRTKKAREKKELQINPVISPNVLKNKLLKRIKEHKARENNVIQPKIQVQENNNSLTYSDEFNSAIDYISQLRRQKEKNKFLNKTVKNYNNDTREYMNISLDLPPELQENNLYSKNQMINAPPLKMNYPSTPNYNNEHDVPYGCLKGGNKPSYRTWLQTRKNTVIPSTSIYTNNTLENFNMPFIRPPTPPKKNDSQETNDQLGLFLSGAKVINNDNNRNDNNISREERLEKIRNKLKKIDEEELTKKRKEIEELNRIGKELGLTDDELDRDLDELPGFEEHSDKPIMPELSELLQKREEQYEKQNPKSAIKKTVRRRFTLGKSDKLRKVAILVKDKKTRKNILNTQKELKKTHINDVRKYLRQHGIIKAGTTCPQDVLRKMFESAMLAGEITNTNKDTILHNFLHSNN